jgi:hypothetical protein
MRIRVFSSVLFYSSTGNYKEAHHETFHVTTRRSLDSLAARP